MVKAVNQYHRLLAQCASESTRKFLARGTSVQRCEKCQLAHFACICPWTFQLSSNVEFVLLLHRNEIFKPTNTGKLIANIFPGRTHAFCWDRTKPTLELIALLTDPNRFCLIVFPVEEGLQSRQVFNALPVTNKLITFILLDGTWKQSGRMFHLSRWLDTVPCVSLPDDMTRGYTIRKSHNETYLSTAEAASLCLTLAGEATSADRLLDYFRLFNLHYVATRGCYPPGVGELHQKLASIKAAVVDEQV